MDNEAHYEKGRKFISEFKQLGEPLLLVRIEDVDVSIRRQPDTKQLWYVRSKRRGSGGAPIGEFFQASKVGSQQVICGPIPAETVSVVAISSLGVKLPVYTKSDVFLTHAAHTLAVTITFKDDQQRLVHILQIPPYPPLPRPSWRNRLWDFGQSIGLLPQPKRHVTYPNRK